MLLLLAILACAPAPDEPVPPAATVEAAPAGSIGGEPILPQPIVVGGIAAEAVDAGIEAQMEGIRACIEAERAKHPDLAGKVLVKFTIAQDGSVREATTRSTSLRNPASEACLIARVVEARFPPLQSGRLAIVHYPFDFPSR